jgi:hypothetical protein
MKKRLMTVGLAGILALTLAGCVDEDNPDFESDFGVTTTPLMDTTVPLTDTTLGG